MYSDTVWFQHVNTSEDFCRCKKCKGSRRVKEKNRQEIFIEKGMADRQRIVLTGAGDQEVTIQLLYASSSI